MGKGAIGAVTQMQLQYQELGEESMAFLVEQQQQSSPSSSDMHPAPGVGAREQRLVRQGASLSVLYLEECTYTSPPSTPPPRLATQAGCTPCRCLGVITKRHPFIQPEALQEPLMAGAVWLSGSCGPHLMSATCQQCWGWQRSGRPLWRRGSPGSRGDRSSFTNPHLQLLEKELGSQWGILWSPAKELLHGPAWARLMEPRKARTRKWNCERGQDRHPEFWRFDEPWGERPSPPSGFPAPGGPQGPRLPLSSTHESE